MTHLHFLARCVCSAMDGTLKSTAVVAATVHKKCCNPWQSLHLQREAKLKMVRVFPAGLRCYIVIDSASNKKFGEEVLSLNLKYLPEERVWFSPSSDNGFEIIVAGDERAPEPTRVQLAEWVLERVSEVRRSAQEFLNASVDLQDLGNSEWWLEGLEFGRSLTDTSKDFDAVFTTDEGGNWNDCRLWLVHCTLTGEGNSRRAIPVGFRTKW